MFIESVNWWGHQSQPEGFWEHSMEIPGLSNYLLVQKREPTRGVFHCTLQRKSRVGTEIKHTLIALAYICKEYLSLEGFLTWPCRQGTEGGGQGVWRTTFYYTILFCSFLMF